MLKVFISHSSLDASLAELLIHLLKDSLRIAASEIRCTSVDGYRLPSGANTDDQLRSEILDSTVFVGLLSPASLDSTYVTFELGARWGVRKHLIPLLVPGLEFKSIKGPVAALNALSCGNSSQLHQFVSDVAGYLGVTLEPAAAYQKWIDQITIYQQPSSFQAQKNDAAHFSNSADTNLSVKKSQTEESVIQGIKARAAAEHPGDFSTQRYVINEQIKSLRQLQNYTDPTVPIEVINEVLETAALEHPGDFSTQLYVVKDQLSSWKQLSL